ncbi:MAG TPA: sigma-54 dependent transcriptional regulator [Puia sp.]|jgi:DNA-binding NtrC family response regulator|nr:sigma-54 dependent transcriptional regulator [Puia sp.]
MRKKILIVEDGFVEANNLRIILERAGFVVTEIASSYDQGVTSLEKNRPDLVLLDIYLSGKKTGIDLAHVLNEKKIAFVYLSANSNDATLAAAKVTQPYGFLVKPFREKDILVTLDIALYLHEQKEKFRQRETSLATFAKPARFEGIIGDSPALKRILQLVQIVAPTDTSVLILGESGTGKEGIADSIHANSPRKEKPLIKVNCAALPAALIESELFGHERGAFTGASDQRVGKFEQAQRGTIFLDEIGEMPVDLQVKLLRVLQEKEIERIGGKGNIKVDIRIIAATNLDLEKAVAEGRFRMDLYYRLNVFPIQLPPLRERKEDIPLLASHFVEQFCRLNDLKVKSISDKAMDSLMIHSWPGNIRELAHLMERSVLLNPDVTIQHISLPEKVVPPGGLPGMGKVKTIEQMEMEHIKSVLAKCNGKISGPGGAAELLELPYSTLVSKIKKLGIKTEKYFR